MIKGQLMYEGSPIICSYIADLVQLYLLQVQTCNLKGYGELCNIITKHTNCSHVLDM